MIPTEELKKITDVINAIDACDGVRIQYSICKKMWALKDSLNNYIIIEEEKKDG